MNVDIILQSCFIRDYLLTVITVIVLLMVANSTYTSFHVISIHLWLLMIFIDVFGNRMFLVTCWWIYVSCSIVWHSLVTSTLGADISRWGREERWYRITHWGRDKIDTSSGRHFQMHFEWKCMNFVKISLKFVPNIPAFVQIMARSRPGDKPLSQPIVVSLPTHKFITRPQWVNIIKLLIISLHEGCSRILSLD